MGPANHKEPVVIDLSNDNDEDDASLLASSSTTKGAEVGDVTVVAVKKAGEPTPADRCESSNCKKVNSDGNGNDNDKNMQKETSKKAVDDDSNKSVQSPKKSSPFQSWLPRRSPSPHRRIIAAKQVLQQTRRNGNDENMKRVTSKKDIDSDNDGNKSPQSTKSAPFSRAWLPRRSPSPHRRITAAKSVLQQQIRGAGLSDEEQCYGDSAQDRPRPLQNKPPHSNTPENDSSKNNGEIPAENNSTFVDCDPANKKESAKQENRQKPETLQEDVVPVQKDAFAENVVPKDVKARDSRRADADLALYCQPCDGVSAQEPNKVMVDSSPEHGTEVRSHKSDQDEADRIAIAENRPVAALEKKTKEATQAKRGCVTCFGNCAQKRCGVCAPCQKQIPRATRCVFYLCPNYSYKPSTLVYYQSLAEKVLAAKVALTEPPRHELESAFRDVYGDDALNRIEASGVSTLDSSTSSMQGAASASTVATVEKDKTHTAEAQAKRRCRTCNGNCVQKRCGLCGPCQKKTVYTRCAFYLCSNYSYRPSTLATYQTLAENVLATKAGFTESLRLELERAFRDAYGKDACEGINFCNGSTVVDAWIAADKAPAAGSAIDTETSGSPANDILTREDLQRQRTKGRERICASCDGCLRERCGICFNCGRRRPDCCVFALCRNLAYSTSTLEIYRRHAGAAISKSPKALASHFEDTYGEKGWAVQLLNGSNETDESGAEVFYRTKPVLPGTRVFCLWTGNGVCHLIDDPFENEKWANAYVSRVFLKEWYWGEVVSKKFKSGKELYHIRFDDSDERKDVEESVMSYSKLTGLASVIGLMRVSCYPQEFVTEEEYVPYPDKCEPHSDDKRKVGH